MSMLIEQIRKNLTDKGLKVTPQRMSILGAIHSLNNHPTADNISVSLTQILQQGRYIKY